MIERQLRLPLAGEETFFLWGSRQTGKTTLLRETYRDCKWIDLLKAEEFRRYLEHPEYLRQEISSRKEDAFIVIDEVQKVPQLLDEVHWLHENTGTHFALCGSSARKVKRGAANLLGGRAIRCELFGFVSTELGSEWDLIRMLNHGYLPRIYLSERPIRLLNSYIADYLKEEVAAEGLVRRLPRFSEFLNIASLSDGEMINFSNIARECGVSSPTVKSYFEILTDTLLGRWLPAFTKRPKRRVIVSPKFYFSDVGVVNFLSKRGTLSPGSSLFGKAFENWCHHELVAYNAYSESFASITYWRLPSGNEVDFIVNNMEVAIEAKSARKITSDHLKGLYKVKEDHSKLKRRMVVCLEDKRRTLSDGIEIIPFNEFSDMLWDGAIF